MKSYLKVLLLAIVFILTGCGSKGAGQEVTFIKGADISSLQAVEDYEGKFYDFDGKEVDALEFLTENGCNYYRLRIWNEPTQSFDAGDYCDLSRTVEMAKRIKDAGINYLLDFHYSDWWADPENQRVPAAWKGMSDEEIVQALYDYTAEVLTTLAEEDAYPDMIQIGNEIGNGMLWDYGTTDKPEMLAALLNSGIKAVRDTTPEGHQVKIMIHTQTGGAVGTTENFLNMLIEQGVTDFDIVGLSYYPYWHGTFADLKDNINNVYAKFGKQVVVAETAYPFTTGNGDKKLNLVSDADVTAVGFEATAENQRKVFELVMNTVAECEGGFGVFYWEPVWLAVEGAGVATGTGNEWENQAMFDFEGKALEAVKAFSYEPGSLDNDTALLVYPLDGIELNLNGTEEEWLASLPATADVLYQDGSIRQVEITWDASSKKQITDTHIAYQGTVQDYAVSIGVDLIDKSKLNNLDFEEGATGWNIDGPAGAGLIASNDTSYPHSGKWDFQFWDDDAFTIDLYQFYTVSMSNQYNLQVWSQGVDNANIVMTLYIADENGNELAAEKFYTTGWNEWKHPCVSVDLEAGTTIKIGVRIEGNSNDWGTLDQFEFYPGEVVSE